MPDVQETPDDVLAEMERGKFGDALKDTTIRIRAALERERGYRGSEIFKRWEQGETGWAEVARQQGEVARWQAKHVALVKAVEDAAEDIAALATIECEWAVPMAARLRAAVKGES